MAYTVSQLAAMSGVSVRTLGRCLDYRSQTAVAFVGRSTYAIRCGVGFFKEENGDYLHTEALKGAKTFAVASLASSTVVLGKDSWPQEIPAPQARLEFDVDNVENATEELESQEHRMLIKQA
jgi:hypothetical protein